MDAAEASALHERLVAYVHALGGAQVSGSVHLGKD